MITHHNHTHVVEDFAGRHILTAEQSFKEGCHIYVAQPSAGDRVYGHLTYDEMFKFIDAIMRGIPTEVTMLKIGSDEVYTPWFYDPDRVTPGGGDPCCYINDVYFFHDSMLEFVECMLDASRDQWEALGEWPQ